MKHYLLLISLVFCLSCHQTGTVEMTFTNWDKKQILTEFKFIDLVSIDAVKYSNIKRHHFPNIKCEAPNKFVLKNVTTGLYMGFIQIDNEYGIYTISWDSILVKPGINQISKEVNFGVGSVL